MTKRIQDLIGKKYGHLTVLGFDHRDSRGEAWLLCKCDCGREKVIRSYSVTSGITTSCGCRWHEIEDLSGRRFGRLVAIEVDSRNWQGKTMWRCRCDCGNETVVKSDSLKSGHTRSCGCLYTENIGKTNLTHGHTGERIHNIWKCMRSRCSNQNNDSYENYGGRGVSVCDEWKNDFQSFYDWSMHNGYADNLSIDRINNDGDYSPENCRWTTALTQANNTRRNRYITYNNITHTCSEWARILGLRKDVLRHRLDNGDMRDFEEYFGEAD